MSCQFDFWNNDLNKKNKTSYISLCCVFACVYVQREWLDSRVVSMLDSGAVGPGFKSKPRVTVLGKLFTPIVPLFTKQRNW